MLQFVPDMGFRNSVQAARFPRGADITGFSQRHSKELI